MFSLREYHAIICNVLALIKTLFDIMRLRKGPDAIPYSSVILLVTLGFWLFAEMTSVVGSMDIPLERRTVGFLVGVTALVIYSLIVQFYGRRERLLQMLSALIGCSALLSLVLTGALTVSNVFGDENPVGMAFAVAALFILPWSVLIEGHILSRTIDQPRFVGVMIAMSVFLLQLYLLEVGFADPQA